MPPKMSTLPTHIRTAKEDIRHQIDDIMAGEVISGFFSLAGIFNLQLYGTYQHVISKRINTSYPDN